MAILEVLTLTLAPVIAKSIFKLWIKDQSIAEDISSSLIDLLSKKINDVVIRQNTKRQLEEVGEKVATSLIPVFDDEILNETNQEAVILAVAETIRSTQLSADILAQNNLDPHTLYKFLLNFSPKGLFFSEEENLLYKRVLEQSAAYIVDISDLFPKVTERSISEVLKRQKELIEVTEFVLKEVQRIQIDSQRANSDPNIAFFEETYRRSISRHLNRPDVFGLTNLSNLSQRYQISVAYISLSVTRSIYQDNKGYLIRNATDKEDVSSVLANTNKIIIRGQAGSGKTTLLKWLAINSAHGMFSGSLESWNNTIPFYIPLRKFVNVQLPAPENFVKIVAPEIAGTMPNQWVHTCLSQKRSLVLIDGIDEVPMSQREIVREWIEALVATYKDTRFVISSRPYAINDRWLEHYDFIEADLQPMELQEIYAFIDNWHAAICTELDNSSEIEEVTKLSLNLRQIVFSNHSIFNIATNPLLCAALCALHRDRHQYLPSSRIEVYEALCEMLLERREKERNIELEGKDYPHLNYMQKRAILESIAYWMITNNWSTVSVEYLDRHISRRIKNLIGLPSNIDEKSIRRLLTDRSGVLREPTIGNIDFVHRTIQEFLAAKALLDNEDFGVLKSNAHDDQWYQVVILASGLATPKVRERIVRDILQRGNKDRASKHKFYLLAVNCLENAVELSPKLQQDIQKHLSEVIPPRDENEASVLASARDLAVPYLRRNENHKETQSMACIEALSKIGTDEAFSVLKTYVSDYRPRVIDTLVMAGRAFDEDKFVEHITSHLHSDELSLSGMFSLNVIRHFTFLKKLSLSNCIYLKKIDEINNFTKLEYLSLENLPIISNLTPLLALQEITSLSLASMRSIDEFSMILASQNLKDLKLHDLPELTDLSSLFYFAGNDSYERLPKITSLLLSSVKVFNLSPLEKFNKLNYLHLINVPVSSLKPLALLPSLRILELDRVPVRDLSDLIQSESLEQIRLGQSFRDIEIPKKLSSKIRARWILR